MTFRISLVQPKFNVLEEHLYAISDPASSRYGQHLSKEHVEELTAPSPDALTAVNDWLFSHGFDVNKLTRSVPKDWVKIKTTVQKAEQMFNTVSGQCEWMFMNILYPPSPKTYHTWKLFKTNESLIRTTKWSVPDFLDPHIDLVHPTTMFRSIQPQASTFRWSTKAPGKAVVMKMPSPVSLAVDPSCNNTITPTCILQLYNATQYKVQAADKGNKIAIASYLGQFSLSKLFTHFDIHLYIHQGTLRMLPTCNTSINF